LVAFSVGVEVGHQAVVLPLYATLDRLRRDGMKIADCGSWRRWGSSAICVAGAYFFYQAIRLAV
jgi:hypothetical protein